MTKACDVSIIVTAHDEGILAHKTMLSVFRAAKKLEEAEMSYEVIVHIDNGTEATKDYFSRYGDNELVTVFQNTFGDLSMSRNFSVENSHGTYITCVDADDLLSENWFTSAYSTVKGKEDIVARVNYVITFGSSPTIITDNSDISSREQRLYLFASNMYGSSFFCHKSIYETTQQRSNTPAYGSEDWQWILDTQAKGIKHVIAPETIHFYRKDPLAKPSLLAGQTLNRAVLSPSKQLSFEVVHQIDISKDIREEDGVTDGGVKHKLKEKLYHTLVYANSFSAYRNIKKKIKPQVKGPAVNLPKNVIDEWKNINKIEKTTCPSEYILQEAKKWTPNKRIGVCYIKLVQSLRQKPDTLFFVPWLMRGGADKVFINTANEINSIRTNWNIAVFQTYPQESLWGDKLNEGIDFADIAAILKGLSYEDKMSLMAMFIVQNNIKRIIIGNSRFAYDFVMRYKKLIEYLDIRLYVFAFTESVDRDGRIGDYIHEKIPYIQDVAYKIVTDNTSIVEQLYKEHAVRKDKVFVHHQFLDNKFREPTISNNHPLRVLWASRVNNQKIPDTLKQIGQNIGDQFEIDVYGVLENHYTEEFFQESGLHYIRSFDGIDDLPIDDYDIFLYTSNADGMPNILLEAASKGLPIVAPDIGGVKDFIKDGETGLLIDDYRDSGAYVQALEKLKDADLRMKLATNAQKLLKKGFTEEKWKRGVVEIFDE